MMLLLIHRQLIIKHDRLVPGSSIPINSGCINISGSPIVPHPIVLMYVTKQMVLWFHPVHHRHQKLCTPSPSTMSTQITDPQGWAVSDQDISVIRYFVPDLQQRLTPIHIETPITEPWLPW